MGLISVIMNMLDVYENTRKTDSNIPKSKPSSRKYDFDAGFSGDRKIDCPKYKPSKENKKKVSKEEKER